LPALEELEEMSTLELEFTTALELDVSFELDSTMLELDVSLELDSAKELLDSVTLLEDKYISLDEDSSSELLDSTKIEEEDSSTPLLELISTLELLSAHSS
jgi:hypothetical protein